MNAQEFAKMVVEHRKWLDGIKGGVCADLDAKGLTDVQRRAFKIMIEGSANINPKTLNKEEV